MRQVWFPPLGFALAAFGLWELGLAQFSHIFKYSQKVRFGEDGLKGCARVGFPLWVLIAGVWAPGAHFGPVFGVFSC